MALAAGMWRGKRLAILPNLIHGPMRLPDFIGIGAMRSGSTTLWSLLRQHHQVFMPDKKELAFFDNRLGSWERGVEWYAAHFENAPAGSLCGEFTPSYLYIEEACTRIKQVVPDARLLVILRNPVDRAWSHYWHCVMLGAEEFDFERALEAEERRLSGMELPNRFAYAYVGRGRYYEQLVRYERHFSRDQLCVILLEDLRAQPQATLDRVYRHLGLPQPERLPTAAAPRENGAGHTRWRKLHVWAHRAYRSAEGKKSMGHRVVRGVASRVLRANLAPGTPPLSPALRQQLSAIFEPSNQMLAQWLGRPLPWR